MQWLITDQHEVYLRGQWGHSDNQIFLSVDHDASSALFSADLTPAVLAIELHRSRLVQGCVTAEPDIAQFDRARLQCCNHLGAEPASLEFRMDPHTAHLGALVVD